MGKTPKDRHGNERRRPYNYPRNAPQAQISGTESRNYRYPPGNVPRRIPVYRNLPYPGIPIGAVQNQPYRFGAGRDFRGRIRGINKPLKPVLNRQRRPDNRTKRVLASPYRKSASRMQSQTGQDTVPDKPKDTNETQGVKNGPESSTHSEDDIKVVRDITSTEVSNNIESCEANGVMDDVSDDAEKNTSKTKAVSKDKKAKKGSTPKGKHSPKTKKDTKTESQNDTVGDTKEKQLSTVGTKEKEKSPKTIEQDSSTGESPPVELLPKVKIVRLTAVQTESSEADDSVVEIHVEKENNLPSIPSTSSDEFIPKIPEAHLVKDSPRRSTRLSTHNIPPKQKTPEKIAAANTIVLDSSDSISVLEVSPPSQEMSYAESLRRLSGRRGLRSHQSYSSSFNRSYTSGSSSVISNASNISASTTSNDSESDCHESKLTQSRYGLWNLFHSPNKNAPQYSATDNESTNRSLPDDSANGSEVTTEPFEVASNVSFRKRKIQESDVLENQKTKKLREDNQKNDGNVSSGLLSLMTSPMNLFASKLRGDKGKSSTPMQLLKASDLVDDEEVDVDGDDAAAHQDASEIQYKEKSASTIIEKESLEALPENSNAEQEAMPRRWCSIM